MATFYFPRMVVKGVDSKGTIKTHAAEETYLTPYLSSVLSYSESG